LIETKEHATVALPPADESPEVPARAATDLEAARAALAAEWMRASPRGPEEITQFYRGAQGLRADLEAWHHLPERQDWTRMLVHVAAQSWAEANGAAKDGHTPFTIVDIGCGVGHDLFALREALPEAVLQGVEPNRELRQRLGAHGIPACADVSSAAIDAADLLVCVDVLEHVPDPEAFLGGIAERAPLGCLLFEATATADVSTPLHLKDNWGWQPGRCLEEHGWELVDRDPASRLRVWRRIAQAAGQRAGLLLCAYRGVAVHTMQSILALCSDPGPNRWRLKVKAGDALIARSRSILVTAWLRETADDVFLMVDDDIVFDPKDADRLTELCRGGYDIVCGAYPVHDGAHLACRMLPQEGRTSVTLDPTGPPVEILYAATGFMAVHRRVIDALVKDRPLCHPDQPWSHYVLFPHMVVRNLDTAMHEYLSEDYGFSHIARQAGFRVYLDPRTRLAHRGEAGLSVRNMAAMHQAIKQA
jgi:SAM-dependent methyltransferase